MSGHGYHGPVGLVPVHSFAVGRFQSSQLYPGSGYWPGNGMSDMVVTNSALTDAERFRKRLDYYRRQHNTNITKFDNWTNAVDEEERQKTAALRQRWLDSRSKRSISAPGRCKGFSIGISRGESVCETVGEQASRMCSQMKRRVTNDCNTRVGSAKAASKSNSKLKRNDDRPVTTVAMNKESVCSIRNISSLNKAVEQCLDNARTGLSDPQKRDGNHQMLLSSFPSNAGNIGNDSVTGCDEVFTDNDIDLGELNEIFQFIDGNPGSENTEFARCLNQEIENVATATVSSLAPEIKPDVLYGTNTIAQAEPHGDKQRAAEEGLVIRKNTLETSEKYSCIKVEENQLQQLPSVVHSSDSVVTGLHQLHGQSSSLCSSSSALQLYSSTSSTSTISTKSTTSMEHPLVRRTDRDLSLTHPGMKLQNYELQPLQKSQWFCAQSVQTGHHNFPYIQQPRNQLNQCLSEQHWIWPTNTIQSNQYLESPFNGCHELGSQFPGYSRISQPVYNSTSGILAGQVMPTSQAIFNYGGDKRIVLPGMEVIRAPGASQSQHLNADVKQEQHSQMHTALTKDHSHNYFIGQHAMSQNRPVNWSEYDDCGLHYFANSSSLHPDRQSNSGPWSLASVQSADEKMLEQMKNCNSAMQNWHAQYQDSSMPRIHTSVSQDSSSLIGFRDHFNNSNATTNHLLPMQDVMLDQEFPKDDLVYQFPPA